MLTGNSADGGYMDADEDMGMQTEMQTRGHRIQLGSTGDEDAYRVMGAWGGKESLGARPRRRGFGKVGPLSSAPHPPAGQREKEERKHLGPV